MAATENRKINVFEPIDSPRIYREIYKIQSLQRKADTPQISLKLRSPTLKKTKLTSDGTSFEQNIPNAPSLNQLTVKEAMDNQQKKRFSLFSIVCLFFPPILYSWIGRLTDYLMTEELGTTTAAYQTLAYPLLQQWQQLETPAQPQTSLKDF